jgi:hypothetical protein
MFWSIADEFVRKRPTEALLLSFAIPMPSSAVIRVSIAAVWLYEGVWCKLLGRTPSQVDVVSAVPHFGRFAAGFIKVLGVFETALGLWAVSGAAPAECAVVQTATLLLLNANGLLWARHLIHEPVGMVVKNAAFLMLVWVSGTLPAGYR